MFNIFFLFGIWRWYADDHFGFWALTKNEMYQSHFDVFPSLTLLLVLFVCVYIVLHKKNVRHTVAD